nr:anti-sigma factor [Leifsonia psychrotolerans]
MNPGNRESAGGLRDLAGAYALNALSSDEKVDYERHLDVSEQARSEAAELAETAAILGRAAAPVQPSAALKFDLMALLASTPQLPPRAVPADAPSSDAAPSATAAPVAPQTPAVPQTPVVPQTPADRAQGAETPSPASPPSALESTVARRWFQRPAGILLSVAAAAALFFGGLAIGQGLTAPTQFEQQQAAGLAEINAAPDAQRATARATDGQKVTLVWSGELGRSALLADSLPTLPKDQAYQLWYIDAAGAVSAGTFTSSGDGTVWRVLDGTMKAGDAVGVTVEPAGGSKQPTSTPIVAIQS